MSQCDECTEHSESVGYRLERVSVKQLTEVANRLTTERHVYTEPLVAIHPCDHSQAVCDLALSRKQHTHAAGRRLEAVASRFEDLEDARRETRRQSTSTVTSFADAQPAAAAPPLPPPGAPPAIVVQPVIPPSVQAFDAIVIEARLKSLIELTADFAPQALVDQVCFSHSKSIITTYVMAPIGGLVRASDSSVARPVDQGRSVQEARPAGFRGAAEPIAGLN